MFMNFSVVAVVVTFFLLRRTVLLAQLHISFRLKEIKNYYLSHTNFKISFRFCFFLYAHFVFKVHTWALRFFFWFIDRNDSQMNFYDLILYIYIFICIVLVKCFLLLFLLLLCVFFYMNRRFSCSRDTDIENWFDHQFPSSYFVAFFFIHCSNSFFV